MKKLITAVILLVALSPFASAKNWGKTSNDFLTANAWHKHGSNSKNFNNDNLNCQMQANDLYPPPPAATKDEHWYCTYIVCMKVNSWNLTSVGENEWVSGYIPSSMVARFKCNSMLSKVSHAPHALKWFYIGRNNNATIYVNSNIIDSGRTKVATIKKFYSNIIKTETLSVNCIQFMFNKVKETDTSVKSSVDKIIPNRAYYPNYGTPEASVIEYACRNTYD